MTPSESAYIQVWLRRGVKFLIDVEDYSPIKKLSFRGHFQNGVWYVTVAVPTIGEDGFKYHQPVLLSRLLKGLDFGDPLEVDHINGNPLDNRKLNLRVCTHEENMQNRRMSASNTSGFKGVTQVGPSRWAVNIRACGKHYYLGMYNSPERAHGVYCEAAVWLHGEFANFGEERSEEFRLVPRPRPSAMPLEIAIAGNRQHWRAVALRTGFIIRPREERPVYSQK